jgi:hypothetical protein
VTVEIFLGLIVVGVVVFSITSLIRWAVDEFVVKRPEL